MFYESKWLSARSRIDENRSRRDKNRAKITKTYRKNASGIKCEQRGAENLRDGAIRSEMVKDGAGRRHGGGQAGGGSKDPEGELQDFATYLARPAPLQSKGRRI